MNFNLFVPPDLQCTELDVAHMVNCNTVTRGWRHRKLFYALKSRIVAAFAVPDGYDLQRWYDEHDEYESQHYAVHEHILARYVLCGHVFHKPIDEFYYEQFDYPNVVKRSPDFGLYSTKGVIEGKKRFVFDREAEAMAWWSLKRLVRKFAPLLYADQQAERLNRAMAQSEGIPF